MKGKKKAIGKLFFRGIAVGRLLRHTMVVKHDPRKTSPSNCSGTYQINRLAMYVLCVSPPYVSLKIFDDLWNVTLVTLGTILHWSIVIFKKK